MSESISPPSAVSLRWYLRRAAVISRFIAALLVTGIAIRFAIAGARHALGISAANFADNPAHHTPDDPQPLASAQDRASPRVPPRASSGISPPLGRALRVTLGVNFGSPRAEVYVNGGRVGQTPFLGDTSCKSGQSIRIEVVPDTGPPLTYLRECRGGSLEINGPPP